jgi:hypothetical protein
MSAAAVSTDSLPGEGDMALWCRNLA